MHHGHSSGSFTAEARTTTHSDLADGYSPWYIASKPVGRRHGLVSTAFTAKKTQQISS